ncbi:hypothetical protein VP01_1411g3 [Puccinia sorghi]|uniref:Uncharacterized protein n=1 Tax=Puccinia sorghi TaxID=27349 RepID=A0A0L6VKT2_9BASI|nr:hypothetical protein VP01_1411g3 [Puccinia sorghi]
MRREIHRHPREEYLRASIQAYSTSPYYPGKVSVLVMSTTLLVYDPPLPLISDLPGGMDSMFIFQNVHRVVTEILGRACRLLDIKLYNHPRSSWDLFGFNLPIHHQCFLGPFWRHSSFCSHCALDFFKEFGPRLDFCGEALSFSLLLSLSEYQVVVPLKFSSQICIFPFSSSNAYSRLVYLIWPYARSNKSLNPPQNCPFHIKFLSSNLNKHKFLLIDFGLRTASCHTPGGSARMNGLSDIQGRIFSCSLSLFCSKLDFPLVQCILRRQSLLAKLFMIINSCLVLLCLVPQPCLIFSGLYPTELPGTSETLKGDLRGKSLGRLSLIFFLIPDMTNSQYSWEYKNYLQYVRLSFNSSHIFFANHLFLVFPCCIGCWSLTTHIAHQISNYQLSPCLWIIFLFNRHCETMGIMRNFVHAFFSSTLYITSNTISRYLLDLSKLQFKKVYKSLKQVSGPHVLCCMWLWNVPAHADTHSNEIMLCRIWHHARSSPNSIKPFHTNSEVPFLIYQLVFIIYLVLVSYLVVVVVLESSSSLNFRDWSGSIRTSTRIVINNQR